MSLFWFLAGSVVGFSGGILLILWEDRRYQAQQDMLRKSNKPQSQNN